MTESHASILQESFGGYNEMIDQGLRPLLFVLLFNISFAGAARCDEVAKPQTTKQNSNGAATDTKPLVSKQTSERLQRIHDESAQAIETRTRALDVHLKAVQQEMEDELSGVAPANANGIVDPYYESKVANTKESGTAKIQALLDAFEVEKKRLTELYESQAKDFETAQQTRSGSQKQTAR